MLHPGLLLPYTPSLALLGLLLTCACASPGSRARTRCVRDLSKRKALTLPIERYPYEGSWEMVATQWQTIERVAPGGASIGIVVRDFEPGRPTDVSIP